MRYAELHCKSNFSFLQAGSHPDELVGRAAELGYHALAITDHNSLAGVVRMHLAAKAHGVRLVIGAEITPVDAPPVLLYATDRAGYGRLARLITRGRLRVPKGECQITFDDVAEYAEGLIAVLIPPSEMIEAARQQDASGLGWSGGGRPERPAGSPELPSAVVKSGNGWLGRLRAYRGVFGDRAYLAAELQRGPDDRQRLEAIKAISRQVRLPLVAAGDVHYHVPERRYLQDVLTCVREHCKLAEAGKRLYANAERHLRPVDQIGRLWAGCPGAVERTVEVADRCRFSLDELRYEYPEELCPAGMTAMQFLTRLTWDGARERFGECISVRVRRLIEHELRLIEELQYEAYFLTVWDLVRFARSRNILCQGRGSAANSAVCYCLGVTAVDPDRIELLFERFVSRERNEPPDIDIDFEHERREEVIQYIYRKYGRERAGMTAEVITYRPRSAVRDVGKALGLSLDRVDVLAKALEWWGDEPLPRDRIREAGLDPDERTIRCLTGLVNRIVGFPRHLSQHVGGFVISQGPLTHLVPIENAAMADRTFIQWDKDDIDALGILKVDCLGLGMLTCLHKCFDLVNHRGDAAPLRLESVPPEAPAVYEMICRADTVGVFQIESRAQMSMLPRLKPRDFYDLVIEVAIVRPGPIQGNMVHPYLRRRNGQEPITYPNAAIQEVLCKTLGVPLFQEQVMRLAMVAAGFAPGDADRLRRAMGAWRRRGLLEQFRKRLLDGMLANGLSRGFAERTFEQIRGFGEYGFPESHAASFALLVYVSAWLKRHYPAAYAAALLNSQPMGFYAPGQIIRDAQEHGVQVRGVDVNFSSYDCTLGRALQTDRAANGQQQQTANASGEAVRSGSPEMWGVGGPAIRLGMRLINGISEANVRGIGQARQDGPFRSVPDVARRADVSRGVLARLAAADAFRSIGLDRREALWEVLALREELPLFAELEPAEEQANLPTLSLDEQVVRDYEAMGLSLVAHPISLVRDELDRFKVTSAARVSACRHGTRVRVAGLVLVRQRPGTASGIVFATIEDETGIVNLVIRPAVYEQCRRAAARAVGLVAEGKVERSGEVIHVQVSSLSDLSDRLNRLRCRSRNFH